VRTLQHEDRMDSFVLSETLKYLYLLFAKPEDLYLGKLTVNFTLPSLIDLFRTRTSLLRSLVWIRIDFGRLYPDRDPHWECGFESRSAKMIHKNKEK
jgi:hypothetical protein